MPGSFLLEKDRLEGSFRITYIASFQGGDKPPKEEKEMNIVLLLFYVAVGIFLLKEIQYGKIQPTKKGVIVYSVGLVALLMLLMGRPEGVLPLFFLV